MPTGRLQSCDQFSVAQCQILIAAGADNAAANGIYARSCPCTYHLLPGVNVGGDAASGLAGSAHRACRLKVMPAV